MKKIIGLLLACFLAVPTVSFAHTHVQTTVPENGATVTAPLKEIKFSVIVAGDVQLPGESK